MRKRIAILIAVFALVIATLIPTQSFAGPITSPGKSQGNGPCVTSGNVNSQTQSVKNPKKACVFVATAAEITTQPTGAASGSQLAIQPVIRIIDASGNTVTSSTVSVVASIASGTGTLSGTTSVTAVAGVATFTDLVITGTAGAFTLTFTPTSLTSATSNSITITAGSASAAAITTQPTGAASGSPLATQPVIRIIDANGNTVTSSTVDVVASIASGSGTLSGTTTATAVAGIATFTDLVITGTAGNFTLTFTPTSLTPVTSNSITITAGVYTVGQTGPGGGLIYYVDNVTGFSCGANYITTGSPTGGLCHYLEVAPSGWNTGADPLKFWAVMEQQSSEVIGIANDTAAYNNALGIGLGYKNSIAIVDQGNGATTAAGLALAYAGGSKSDWYLPTTAELNLLCQWNRGVTQDVTAFCVGGSGTNSATYGASSAGISGYYWSSSEAAINSAWYQWIGNGSQGANPKSDNSNFRVRPVRAF